MDPDNAEPASSEAILYITAADLPLSCPMPHRRLWDSHPRVYLPISSQGPMTCPYCNTTYQLVDKKSLPAQSTHDSTPV